MPDSFLDQNKNSFDRVHNAIQAFKRGEMVIMVDDEDRENEGDLVFAADVVSAEKINFMTKEARGLICLAMEPSYIDRLQLPLMEDGLKEAGQQSTAFTLSIEAKRGVTTGISAADRAETVRVAASPGSGPEDIVVPGHIFPLRARMGGVLTRAGHTEGSVDLAKLAGYGGTAVICEIMNDDGSMARMPDLETFAKKFSMPIVTIADLIQYRLQHESFIEQIDSSEIKTEFGSFKSYLFKSLVDGQTHLALTKGLDTTDECDEVVEVRVHRQRPWVDAFGAAKHGTRKRLVNGFEMLRDCQHGVLLYLTNSFDEHTLQNEFRDLSDVLDKNAASAKSSPKAKPSSKMDHRSLGVGAQIIRQLGVRRMRLHLPGKAQFKGLVGFGLELVDTAQLPSSSQNSSKADHSSRGQHGG